jgi:hypothetical protein
LLLVMTVDAMSNWLEGCPGLFSCHVNLIYHIGLRRLSLVLTVSTSLVQLLRPWPIPSQMIGEITLSLLGKGPGHDRIGVHIQFQARD